MRTHRIRRVIGLLAAVLLLLPSWASAQGTVMPYARIQFFTNTGAVCNGCLLNSYAAGTSTREDTFSESTLTTANANPVVLDSAGRAIVYLSATSYRFVLTDSTGGTTYWDADPVTAVPTTAGNVDITGTAGAALAAGDVIYLSDGSGSLTAGRWYTADADNTYSSSTAGLVGVATADIASAASGTIRLTGRVTGLSGLTAGEFYYASATAGALTATPPVNARFIGKADSTSTLVMGGGEGAVRVPDSDGTHSLSFITTSDLTADRRITILPGDSNRQITLNGDPTLNDWFDQGVKTTADPTFDDLTVTSCAGCASLGTMDGRLTLTTAVPVTTADVTAAGTLYYTPYAGNQVVLFNGSIWRAYSLTERSLAITCTANNSYDVFLYDNAGTLTLETLIWTNATTRATALTTQNGVLVLTGSLTRRYLGSFYCTATNQTEDSFARRMVWNYYHRVPRALRVVEATNTWTYSTATLRQANGAAGNQLDVMVGVAEVPISVEVVAHAESDQAPGGIIFQVGIGEDSTSTQHTGVIGRLAFNYVANTRTQVWASLKTYPAVGRHTYVWLEYSTGTATTTWSGDNGGTLVQSGIHGVIEG